jgi:N-acetylmuramoyl-L-alanine amidase
VHANASPSENAYGTETFVMGLHKSEDNLRVAQRENSVILMEDDHKEEYNNFNPKSAEAYIMFSMYQSAYLDQSIEYASYVEEQFKKSGRKSRGVKQAGFLVLYRTSMPSVLIESGFLTNDKEERKLKSERGRKKTARAIAKGFSKFKKRIETVAEKDQATNQEVVFKVQILSASKQVDLEKSHYDQLEEIETHKESDKSYKYLSGSFQKADEAVTHRDKLRKKGFSGAFVVAYQGGQRIPFEEAISMQK